MLEKDIRKKMIEMLPIGEIMFQPIESPNTGTGILDTFYRSFHQDGWIELKCIKNYPKRSTIIKIPWRPGQMNWVKKYRRLNGNVFLFLYIENALWVFKKECIKQFYTESDMLILSSYRELWKKVNWEHIYNLLDDSLINRCLSIKG